LKRVLLVKIETWSPDEGREHVVPDQHQLANRPARPVVRRLLSGRGAHEDRRALECRRVRREPKQLGSSRSISSSPNASTAAGGETWRDDEIVVPELDAPQHRGGDLRSDLESELVYTKTIFHMIRQAVVLLQAAARRSGMSMARQGRGTEQGACDLVERRHDAFSFLELVR
jgi:hypothetical protein